MAIACASLPPVRPVVPAPAAAPATQVSEVEQHIAQGRDLADTIKSRSTLVMLVQPGAIAAGILSHPGPTLHAVEGIASSVFHGNLSAAGSQIGNLSNTAFHPTGIPGDIYQGSLYLQAGVGGLVGGVEVYQGVKNHDKWLGMMGGADLVGSGSALALALNSSTPALAMGIGSAVAKVGLVCAHPKEYSRIQKAKVLFDSAGAVSSTLLKVGVAPVPALIANAVLGPTELLYMNNKAFRGRVDKIVDWLLHHIPHPHAH